MPIPSTTPFLSTSPSYQFFKFLLSPVSPTFLLLLVYAYFPTPSSSSMPSIRTTTYSNYYYPSPSMSWSYSSSPSPTTSTTTILLLLSSRSLRSPVLLHTSPRLCRDPTPRHQSLTSWTLTFHHSPVPPTSPTTPSVADSVYVANLRLPGWKETPVHHLCRNPPSPWLNRDTRSSPVSKTCVFLAKRRHQFTTKSRHISHKYPVISELFPKSMLSQFLKHDTFSMIIPSFEHDNLLMHVGH